MTAFAPSASMTFGRHLLGVLAAAAAAASPFAVLSALTASDLGGHSPFAIAALAWVVMFVVTGLASFAVFTLAWPFTRTLGPERLIVSLALGAATQYLLQWADRLTGKGVLTLDKVALAVATAAVIGTVYARVTRRS